MQLTPPSKHWHQYPLVWMMISIPFSAVIMGVVMMWLAVDTDDGLVADDYYKQGLEINRVLSRDKNAAELGLSAIIEFDNSARIMTVKFEKGLLASFPDKLPLQLQHATRANSDITVWLDHGIDDQYIGHADQSISEGVWYFQISGKATDDTDWRISARTVVHVNNIIELRSNY